MWLLLIDGVRDQKKHLKEGKNLRCELLAHDYLIEAGSRRSGAPAAQGKNAATPPWTVFTLAAARSKTSKRKAARVFLRKRLS